MKKLALIIMGTITLFGCNQQPQRYSVKAYPETRKDTTVVEDYFSTKVADPYRWLENDTSAETSAWVVELVAICLMLTHSTKRE